MATAAPAVAAAPLTRRRLVVRRLLSLTMLLSASGGVCCPLSVISFGSIRASPPPNRKLRASLTGPGRDRRAFVVQISLRFAVSGQQARAAQVVGQLAHVGG